MFSLSSIIVDRTKNFMEIGHFYLNCLTALICKAKKHNLLHRGTSKQMKYDFLRGNSKQMTDTQLSLWSMIFKYLSREGDIKFHSV